MKWLAVITILLAGVANAQHRCWDGEGRIVTSKWTCSDLGLPRAPSAEVVQAEREQALRAGQIEANRRAAQERAARAAQSAQAAERSNRQGIPRGAGPSNHVAPVAPGAPRSAINVQNGQYMPGVAGGIIDPRNGTFHQDVGGGYVNSRTGQFSPKIGGQ